MIDAYAGVGLQGAADGTDFHRYLYFADQVPGRVFVPLGQSLVPAAAGGV